ncbi:MAG: hypothetical protein PHU21_10110 [Elusimicrobia bacterium]|nr:hypothetical protein [Elusimicrobiota bacterium]
MKRLALACAATLAALCLSEAAYRGILLLRSALSHDPRAYTVYALGGSTTNGQPFPRRAAFPEMASAMLESSMPGRSIQVRNLARSGENIYFQWVRLRRAAAYHKGQGAVLVYAGVEPGGPHPDQGLGRAARWGRWLERRICARSFVLGDLLALWRGAFRRGAAFDISFYDFYLLQAVRCAQENGLTPVLSTLVSNIAEMEPNFAGDEQTPPDEPKAVEGLRLEKAKLWRRAAAYYAATAAPQEPLRPWLLYRQAKCFQALRRWDEARELHWQAVESEYKHRFNRPSRALNAAVRRTAAESGALLADSAALFERDSPHGLPGGALFADFNHPNLRGYALLARSFAEALGARPQDADWREAELRRRFSISDEDMAAAWRNSGALLLECAGTLYPWPEDRLAMARRAFTEALRLQPDDRRARLGLTMVSAPNWRPLLRSREAMTPFLVSLGRGRPPKPEPAARAAAPKAPAVPDPRQTQAKLLNDRAVALGQAGRISEAAALAARAAALDPDSGEAALTYGTLKLRLQDRGGAAAAWRRALERPSLRAGHGTRALLKESLGKTAP